MYRSEIGKISKALSDETRVRIFEAISATEHMTFRPEANISLTIPFA